jgi:Skp family chaperone for outer membrane proteins
MRQAAKSDWRSTKRWVFWLLCFAVFQSTPIGLAAQQLGTPQGQILTIEPDRLYNDSEFGKRVVRQLEAESAVLVAENRRIEAELTAEEKELTIRRTEIQPEAFRTLADAFDKKVQETRRTQDAKTRELSQRSDARRRIFLQTARPILENLMRETGAGVILDRDTIFLSANATDITNLAIERINLVLGDGSQLDDNISP